MNEKLHETMNRQIIAEFESALVYQQLSYELERLSFTGMSTWMADQAAEERVHAGKFADHLLARGERVQLGNMEIPPVQVDAPLAAFEIGRAHV